VLLPKYEMAFPIAKLKGNMEFLRAHYICMQLGELSWEVGQDHAQY